METLTKNSQNIENSVEHAQGLELGPSYQYHRYCGMKIKYPSSVDVLGVRTHYRYEPAALRKPHSERKKVVALKRKNRVVKRVPMRTQYDNWTLADIDSILEKSPPTFADGRRGQGFLGKYQNAIKMLRVRDYSCVYVSNFKEDPVMCETMLDLLRMIPFAPLVWKDQFHRHPFMFSRHRAINTTPGVFKAFRLLLSMMPHNSHSFEWSPRKYLRKWKQLLQTDMGRRISERIQDFNVPLKELVLKQKNYDHAVRFMSEKFDNSVYEVDQQMDTGAVVTNDANSTTVLQNTESVVETDVDEVISIPELVRMSTEPTFVPEQLTDRWVKLDTFAWTGAGIVGEDNTRTYTLPRMLGATTTTLCESLVTAMWQLNRTQRTAMEFRFICPSQAMLSGQLVAKFYYEAEADRDIKYRYNRYSMTHGKNVKIRPGAKTAATLRVPFNNRNSAFSNQTTTYDKGSVLNMGNLVVSVLNHLRAGPDVTPTIDVSIEMRFISSIFHGRKPATLLVTPKDSVEVEQQGLIKDAVDMIPGKETILETVHEAEAMLNSVSKTQNEDKPPDVDKKVVMIPRFAESFAAGTSTTEMLQPLRLDIRGKKPSVLKTGNSGDIKKMCTDDGLFRQFTWSTSMARGTVLASFPVEPVSDAQNYETLIVDGQIGFAMPPVDVVSSNFTYFSGNLIYSIEAVNTAFHNGALIACTIPLVDEQDIPVAPTINQFSNVKREVMELGNGVSVMEVTTDYHNLNPIMGIRSGDRFSQTPRRSMGMMYIIVYSPLQANQTAAQTIDVNVYKRGAPDYELLEVKSAILCPLFDSNVVPHEADFWKDNANSPDFQAETNGGSHEYYIRANPEWCTFNAKPGLPWPQVARVIRQPTAPNQVERWIELTGHLLAYTENPNNRYRFRNVMIFKAMAPDGSVQNCAFPMIEEVFALGNWQPITYHNIDHWAHLSSAINGFQKNPDLVQWNTIVPYLCTADSNGIHSQYFSQYFDAPHPGSALLGIGDTITPTVQVEQQTGAAAMTAGNQIDTTVNTQYGYRIFGESSSEIMDIMRRPVYRGQFSYRPSRDLEWPLAHVTVDTSHFFVPEDLSNSVNYANRWPTQAVLQLGYLWVSGSLNRRIIAPTIPNTNMWVNHKVYDKPDNDAFLRVHNVADVVNKPVFIQSIASEITSLDVNNHLNVSYPWKQENVRNLLCRRVTQPDLSIRQCYDLGRSEIGFQNMTSDRLDTDFTINIFDSYADDCELSGYRGFPLMMFNSQIEESPSRFVEQQTGGGFSKFFMEKTGLQKNFDMNMDEAAHKIALAIAKESDNAVEVLKTELTKLVDTVYQHHTHLNLTKLTTILAGETMHLMANANKKTLIVSFLNVFLQLGFYNFEIFQSLLTELERLINPKKPESGTEVTQQSSAAESDDIIGSIVALLASGICSYIGWNHPLTKNVDWKMKIAMLFPSFVGGAWSFKRFMNNFFPLLKWLWEYILRLKVYIMDEVECGFVDSSKNYLTAWIKEVNELCRDGNACINPMDRDRIFVAQQIGEVIERKILTKTNRFAVFRKYVDKINAKYATVLNEGDAPYVRKEPYSIWLYGASGVGKSHLIDSLTTELCMRNNIEVPEEKTLILNPASKYTTRVNKQVEMRIDDFMAITSSEFCQSQLSYVFDVMTCAPYNPVQAEVEKKSQLFAPHFLTICSNMAYPLGMPIATPSAFLRRRNVTIQVVPNEQHLSAFGDEYHAIKERPGFIYGQLPDKMKVDNAHLKFRFVQVSQDNFEAKPLTIRGRTEHTYKELVELIDSDYKEHCIRATASYKSRLAQFWMVKRKEVPKFHDLLNLDDEPSLSVLVSKWLAEFENDQPLAKKCDEILKNLHRSSTENASAQRMRQVIDAFYSAHEQQGLLDGCSKDTFLESYPVVCRKEVGEILGTMDEKQMVFGNSSYLVTKIGGKEEQMPLEYEILKRTNCKHKMTGNATKDLENLLEDNDCGSGCLCTLTVKEILIPFLAVSQNDPKLVAKSRNFLMRGVCTIKNVFSYAASKIKLTLKKVYESIKFMGVSIYEFVKNHWKVLSAAVAGTFLAYYAFMKDSDAEAYILKMMPNGDLLTRAGQPFYAVGKEISRFKDRMFGKNISQQAYNNKDRYVTRNTVEQQTGMGLDVTRRLCKDAYVTLVCKMSPEYSKVRREVELFHAFRYGGRRAVMIYHEYELMMKYAENVTALMYTKTGKMFEVEIDHHELKWKSFSHYLKGQPIRHGNFGVIRLPVQIPAARTLTRYKDGKIVSSAFQTKQTVTGDKAIFMAPPYIDDDGTYFYVESVRYRYSTTAAYAKPMVDPITNENMTTRTVYSCVYEYDAEKAGFCLGVLIDLQTDKIIGFHFGGSNGVGIAEKVTADMLPSDEWEYDVPVLAEPNTSFDAIASAIMPIGMSNERHQQSSATGIEKSFIHGCVPVQTEPSILSPNDERNDLSWSPLYEGVKKHGLPPRVFPAAWVESAVADMSDKFMNLKPVRLFPVEQYQLRPLTMEEAVFGIPGVINSMDFTTSLGFGWKNTGKGKASVVDAETKFMAPELIRRVADLQNTIATGTVPFVLSVDCLKDETLKKEKISKVGSTRIISTLPFEYQILLRMYTMHFVTTHQCNNLNFEHAIGISTIGPNQWQFDRLAKMLEGGNIIAGDFKNFGPGASAQVAQAACQVIRKWYTDHGNSSADDRILDGILQCLVNTPHLCYDKVYQTCCGIISGSGLTVVLNSLIHSLYMRIAAIGLGMSLRQWNENVFYWTYGDDGIGKVMDNMLDTYNMMTLSKFFEDFGIVYTAVDKEKVARTHCALKDTSFLKHSFVLRNDTYLAALDKCSIENQLNWVSKRGSNIENTRVNAGTALEQAYAHGEAYYNNLRRIIVRAFSDRGESIILPTYKEVAIERAMTRQPESFMSVRTLRRILQGFEKTEDPENTKSAGEDALAARPIASV